MERSSRTRILVSPSLSAPFPFTDGVALHGLDCGGFTPFPSLLHEQTGASSAIKFSGSDLSFHPFMMIEHVDPASRALIPAPTSFKVDSSGFIQLPNLLSLEPPQDPFMERLITCSTRRNWIDDASASQNPKCTPLKRSRMCSQYWRPPPLAPPPHQQLVEERIMRTHQTPSPSSTERSRQRRQLISERIRILEKLMPWERRMDAGTMLEEASKYIKFLEAQVTALETMPAASGFTPPSLPPKNAFGMERLTRQQLLQVMVSSSIIQNMLYKKGFCIVSVEQVALLRQAKERRMQPLLLLGHLGRG
ncbi:Transcription factor bHLH117 [Platanthera zijinensis]|uniref:Transcription factor bHLH117 n=1 Tax=Platanthera zijinensis TaxID=2320716 RepID=A0AAP0FWF1_9ASPA